MLKIGLFLGLILEKDNKIWCWHIDFVSFPISVSWYYAQSQGVDSFYIKTDIEWKIYEIKRFLQNKSICVFRFCHHAFKRPQSSLESGLFCFKIGDHEKIITQPLNLKQTWNQCAEYCVLSSYSILRELGSADT